MGTPEAMYDQSGEKTWECTLNSYGKVRNFKGEKKSDCPFRYQGQYEDAETGLYYNRFRYYSPDEGMYISQDPIGLNGGHTLYSYVHDPNGWVDIFGLSTSSDAVELRANMREAGIPEPEYRNSAHHIVLSNSTNDRATELRTHMNNLGIQTNSAANGVYLPTSSAVKEASGTDALAHSRVHTNAYIDNIYSRLININDKDEFEAELQNIAGELQDGTCVI